MNSLVQNNQQSYFNALENNPYYRQASVGSLGVASKPLSIPSFSADVFHSTLRFGSNTKSTNKKKKSFGERMNNFFILDPCIKFMSSMATRPKFANFIFALQGLFNFNKVKMMPVKEVKKYLGDAEEVTVRSIGREPNGNTIDLKCYWVEGKSKKNTKMSNKWKRKNNQKTIVFGHGITQDWRAMVANAKPFVEAGYNAMFINFRAHGGSSGKRTTFGFEEAKDMTSVINWVKKNKQKDSKTLIYHGFSLGANAALFAHKSLLPHHKEDYKNLIDNVDAFILDSPTDRLSHFVSRVAINHIASRPTGKLMKWLGAKDEYKKLSARMVEKLENDGPKLLKMENDIIDDDLIDEFNIKDDSGDVINELAKKPLLFVHGTEDEVVAWKSHDLNGNTLPGAQGRYKNFGGEEYAKSFIFELEGQGHGKVEWRPYVKEKSNSKKKYLTACRGLDNYTNAVARFLKDDKFKLPKVIDLPQSGETGQAAAA